MWSEQVLFVYLGIHVSVCVCERERDNKKQKRGHGFECVGLYMGGYRGKKE